MPVKKPATIPELVAWFEERIRRLERKRVTIPTGTGGGSGGSFVPGPGVQVTPETEYDLPASVGVNQQRYAIEDHTHGTPPEPEIPELTFSDTVVTEQSFSQASDPGVEETIARGDHTHGTPASPGGGGGGGTDGLVSWVGL